VPHVSLQRILQCCRPWRIHRGLEEKYTLLGLFQQCCCLCLRCVGWLVHLQEHFLVHLCEVSLAHQDFLNSSISPLVRASIDSNRKGRRVGNSIVGGVRVTWFRVAAKWPLTGRAEVLRVSIIWPFLMSTVDSRCRMRIIIQVGWWYRCARPSSNC